MTDTEMATEMATVPPSTLWEAEERLQRIRETRPAAVEHFNLVLMAFRARDWETLGYSSWLDYCEAVFDDMPPLATADRNALMVALAAEGMSTRAIASAAGVSQSTAARAAREEQVSHDDSPAGRTGLDGKSYPASAEPVPADPPERDETHAAEDDPVWVKVRDLSPRFESALVDVEKSVRRLQKLTEDGGWCANKVAISNSYFNRVSLTHDDLGSILVGLVFADQEMPEDSSVAVEMVHAAQESARAVEE